MNNRYVYLWLGDDEPMRMIRKSQLPDGAHDFGRNVFGLPAKPLRPARFPHHPPRGGAGRIKASPRAGLIRRHWDAELTRNPWHGPGKLRWRHAGKAKRHVARVSRRKARVMLRTSDPEGEANFKQSWGITLRDIY